MKIRSIMCLVVLAFCFTGNSAMADVLIAAPLAIGTEIQQTPISQDHIKYESAFWKISMKDYEHYLWLMKNTPSGHWYKRLDPAEVLALNSNNQNEMLRYAKCEAKLMHCRVGQELAFDLLYAEAYREEYPNERPIMPSDVKSLSGQLLRPGDRVWLFIGIHSPLGKFIYQYLMKTVRAIPNTALDIYFVGKDLSRERIQAWAIANKISPGIINKQVTLNFGNTRFTSIENGKTLNLPFVGIIHDEHFQPITLSSVL